jgi:plastocyanin domain-containing protein
MSRLTLTLFAAAVAIMPLAGRAETPAAKTPKTVQMTLSDAGVSPTEVKATKGETLRLAITRKTDATCVKQLVVQDYGINQPLPLNKTVFVDITPKAAGKVRFLCGMGMNFATMVVQ